MEVQLSLKAAMPLAEILATCHENVSNTGPWAAMTCAKFEIWCDHYTPAKRSWRGGILDSPCPSVCPYVRLSVCRRHGFRSISQVCFGISISNFICMLMVAIGRSLLIFSDVTFKIIPPPNEVGGGVYWIHLVRPSVRPSVCRRHGFRSISQVCFGISISNFICMLMVAIGRSLLTFSDVTFKMAAWRPYWSFWFPDSNFSLALNINFKLQRHNTYVYG